MNSIKAIQDEIIEEFSLFEDWMQRYEYMIELGKSLPLINNDYKTDKYISFDEFKAQQDSDIDISLNLEAERIYGK